MKDDQTNETKNRELHRLLGRCWHEFTNVIDDPSKLVPICTNCFQYIEDAKNPDYLSPDSPRRLLDEVEREVIKRSSLIEYGEALRDVMRITVQLPNRCTALGATASPEDRVTALIEVLKERGE